MQTSFKNILLIILFTQLFFQSNVHSQCWSFFSDLSEKYYSDTSFILRDYRVRLEKGEKSEPLPSKEYPLTLNKGIYYNFSIYNYYDNSGKGIMAIYKDNKKIAIAREGKPVNLFCKNTNRYKIVFTTEEGREACIYGLINMEFEKSDKVFRQLISEVDSNEFIIYTGIDNYVELTEESNEKIVEAEIDEGIIRGRRGRYRIKAEEPGRANLKLKAINKETDTLREITYNFKIDTLPLPFLTFNGKTGGLIDQDDLFDGTGLELKYDVVLDYKPHVLVQFTVSKDMEGSPDFISFSDEFTANQWELISNLTSGSVFYIKNILVTGPNNKLYKLDPVAFVIR